MEGYRAFLLSTRFLSLPDSPKKSQCSPRQADLNCSFLTENKACENYIKEVNYNLELI